MGEVRVTARGRGSRLAGLRHSGSARCLLPRTATDDLQAVLLNTAGGVTGGDRFSWHGTAEDGAHLTLSTQAAERAYRAQPKETGEVHTVLSAGADARIDWLPQETIVFDGARLARRLEADLAPDATLLAVEAVIFGRTAMGERLERFDLTDHWRVRVDGRLVYADALRLAGAGERVLDRPALLCGARAMASIVLVSPRAEGLLAPVRALMPESGGASVVAPGVLSARMVARDGAALRRVLPAILECLRGAALPKVWRL